MSIFDETLDDLITRCERYTTVNAQEVRDTAAQVIRHKESSAAKCLATLEDQWYASIDNDDPDYSVYAHHDYIAEAWGCWIIYSRKYLKNIQKDNSFSAKRSIVSVLDKVETVVDLGCGFGHTAAALKEIFPYARVIGTNIPDTLQMHVAKQLGDEYDFMMDFEPPPVRADVVFASEYFEHIEAPLDHLAMIVDRMRPTVMIVANAFGQRAIGHFVEYQAGGRVIHGSMMNRVFTYAMNKLGYQRIKTKMWNQRPTLWARVS